MIKEALQRPGAIRWVTRYLNDNGVYTAYKAFVRPKIVYSSQTFWSALGQTWPSQAAGTWHMTLWGNHNRISWAEKGAAAAGLMCKLLSGDVTTKIPHSKMCRSQCREPPETCQTGRRQVTPPRPVSVRQPHQIIGSISKRSFWGRIHHVGVNRRVSAHPMSRLEGSRELMGRANKYVAYTASRIDLFYTTLYCIIPAHTRLHLPQKHVTSCENTTSAGYSQWHSFANSVSPRVIWTPSDNPVWICLIMQLTSSSCYLRWSSIPYIAWEFNALSKVSKALSAKHKCREIRALWYWTQYIAYN